MVNRIYQGKVTEIKYKKDDLDFGIVTLYFQGGLYLPSTLLAPTPMNVANMVNVTIACFTIILTDLNLLRFTNIFSYQNFAWNHQILSQNFYTCYANFSA